MAMYSVVTRTVAGCLVGATGLLGFLSPAGAQTSQQCETADFGGFTLLEPEKPRTPIVAIDLPAGTVDITKAHSWDGYDARVNILQLSEIWEVEFIGADGAIVGVSAPTPDLEDNVIEAHWNGSLGSVTLSAPAVGVRAHHLPDLDPGKKNSVHASDIEVCFDVTIPTTTVAPTTTEAPTTTTATEPTTTTAPPPSGPTITGPTCPVDGNGDPVDPSDPDCQQPTTTVACPLDGNGDPVDATDPDCPQPTTTTAPPPKGPSLPVTGSESTVLLLGGMWFLAAGSTMVAFSRNR